MLAININTPSLIMEQLKNNYKEKRLSLNLTQEGVANKSGVSLGSLKRFEASGQISLESLLKLSVVLECLEDFINIADNKNATPFSSIDEIIQKKKKPIKKRGSLK